MNMVNCWEEGHVLRILFVVKPLKTMVYQQRYMLVMVVRFLWDWIWTMITEGKELWRKAYEIPSIIELFEEE